MQCTATSKQSNTQCKRSAVPGATVCVIHGGRAPQVQAAATRRLVLEQAVREVQLWGGRRDLHPTEALLELVGSKAAEVAYWESRVAELDHDQLGWGVTREKHGGDDGGTTWEAKLNVALDQLHIAQRDLKEFAAASLKAGVDEAHVKLRRTQAEQAVAVLQAALADPRIGVAPEVQRLVILDAVRGMQQQEV